MYSFLFLNSGDRTSADGAPNAQHLSCLESCIKNQSPAEFYEDNDLMLWYVEMMHRYTIRVDDDGEASKMLMDNSGFKGIHQVVNPVQEAFAITVLLNNYEGWERKMGLAADDKARLLNMTRWTRNPKKEKGKVTKIRVQNESGWSKDGQDFYREAIDFFKDLRSERNGEEFRKLQEMADTWYCTNVLVKKSGAGRSRKRARIDVGVDRVAADYADLF